MSEETTHNLPDSRSFEERVFTRFDALDAGIRDLNVRVERLEAEYIIGHKLDALAEDMLTLRAKQSQLEARIDKLESKPLG